MCGPASGGHPCEDFSPARRKSSQMWGKRRPSTERDESERQLTSIPTTLVLTDLTSLVLDRNHLRSSHLELVLTEAASLRSLSVRDNLIMCVPDQLRQRRRLKTLDLAGNPLAWPVFPPQCASLTKRSLWLDAMDTALGKCVYRLYLHEDGDHVHYVDMEVALFADPMWPDGKDEDRGLVRVALAHGGSMDVSEHSLKTVRPPEADALHSFSLEARPGFNWRLFQPPAPVVSPQSGTVASPLSFLLRSLLTRSVPPRHLYPITSLFAGVFDGHGGKTGTCFFSLALTVVQETWFPRH